MAAFPPPICAACSVFLPGLARKAEQARLEGREELVAQIDYLMDLVNSPLLEDVTDPLPAAWAEFGIAVQYLLKGVDFVAGLRRRHRPGR